MFKKIFQYAGTADGEDIKVEPTPRLLALLKCPNGAQAQQLFKTWHDTDIVVQTSMATSLTKGCVISSGGPFSINTFSPFLTPPERAGFQIINHQELNKLGLLADSKLLTVENVQKLIEANPYVPSDPTMLYNTIKNFYIVLDDVFGEEAFITHAVGRCVKHFHSNEQLYWHLFRDHEFFAVWYLNRLHLKIQQVFHHCAKADAVIDVPFHRFTMDRELEDIESNAINPVAPRWFLDRLDSIAAKQNNSNTTNNNNNNKKNPRGSENKLNNTDPSPTRRSITNDNVNAATKLRSDETYSHLINAANRKQNKSDEVFLHGKSVCNNWHIRGACWDTCQRKSSHVPLSGETLSKYKAYVEKLRASSQKFSEKLRAQASQNQTENSTGEQNSRD